MLVSRGHKVKVGWLMCWVLMMILFLVFDQRSPHILTRDNCLSPPADMFLFQLKFIAYLVIKSNIHLFIDEIDGQVLEGLEIKSCQWHPLCIPHVSELEQEGDFWLQFHGWWGLRYLSVLLLLFLLLLEWYTNNFSCRICQLLNRSWWVGGI